MSAEKYEEQPHHDDGLVSGAPGTVLRSQKAGQAEPAHGQPADAQKRPPADAVTIAVLVAD